MMYPQKIQFSTIILNTAVFISIMGLDTIYACPFQVAGEDQNYHGSSRIVSGEERQGDAESTPESDSNTLPHQTPILRRQKAQVPKNWDPLVRSEEYNNNAPTQDSASSTFPS